ncbi:hypothetical protein FQN60_006045, partial [Etheostoma spectabile]
THTAVHNHRNLSQGPWPPAGSAPSYIEDLQVGVVKNLHGDSQPAVVVKTTTSGAEVPEKNRNAINHERQQAQARSSTSDNLLSSSTLTPASTLCTLLESHHTGGAVPSVCRPLTEEDLETQKLDPKEVDKNLRESSEENLMERSQKQFGSTEQRRTNLLHRQILQTAEGNSPVSVPQGELGGVGGVLTIHPLPKQQNMPQRPTSLPFLHKTKETASSRLKLGKSNHKQVETGVAKMNTVVVATAAEPRQVTAVTINTSTRGGGGAAVSRVHSKTSVASGYSAGAPTLMTNVLIGGGQTNPAGPQLEDEDKMEAGEDQGINLLNASPDEHEPLLSREQQPAESQPGSNANNNNNRTAWASNKVQGSDPDPCVRRVLCAGPASIPRSSRSPETCLCAGPASIPGFSKSRETRLCAEPESTPGCSRSPEICLCAGPVSNPGSSRTPETRLIQTQTEEAPGIVPNALRSPASASSKAKAPVLHKALNPPVSDPNPPVSESQHQKPTALLEPAVALRRPAFDPQSPALDPDFEFITGGGGGSQTHFPSGCHGAGSFGIPKINQSKSSM